MRTPENTQHAINWIKKNAKNVVCPTCAGKRRPDIYSDSLVQGLMLCPRCRKLWIYRCDHSMARSKWKAYWYYAKDQLDGYFTTTKD